MPVKMDAEPAVFDNDALALQYVINTLINGKVNTCEVVRVVSVDEPNNEVAVIPVVKNVDAMGNSIEESVIYGVNYIRWQFGVNAIMAVPEVGDIGIIVVSKRDISKIDSGVVDSRRKFNLADSIYIGGLCGFNQSPTQYIKFDSSGIEITSPTAININAPTVNASMDNATIAVTGTATITGGTVAVTGGSVSVSGSSVSIGSGSGEKAVCLDGDPVYSGGNIIGTVQASSTVVKAN